MTIFVGQIYINVGVAFPFSLRFQKWFGAELNRRISSEALRECLPADFDLGLRISAKSEIQKPEIVGPTVFKRDKNVEFTIFLPHSGGDYHNQEACRGVFHLLIQSVVAVLDKLHIDSAKISNDAVELVAQFMAIPGLIDKQ